MTLRLLDLFSGIGGFSLGLERAGFQTVAFCEIDPFCRRVLARHWPEVPCYDDIATLTADRLAADRIGRIDAICGGFPCQDLSLAGSGLGLAGERSGLWREYARLIREIQPRFVFVENVSALLGRGLGDVLGDLAAVGYDAVWNCIPAAAVGAPHRRDRVWIVAADADGGRCELERRARRPDVQGACRGEPDGLGTRGHQHWPSSDNLDARSIRLAQWSRLQRSIARQIAAASAPWEWSAEPPFRRVDDGVRKRVERARLKALGNAVVPQIPEILGRAVAEAFNSAAQRSMTPTPGSTRATTRDPDARSCAPVQRARARELGA